MLEQMMNKIDRIEINITILSEKVDELVYPDESKIRPEFVKEIERVEQEMKQGKAKRFGSKGEVKAWLKQM